jgi:hypothetical protein
MHAHQLHVPAYYRFTVASPLMVDEQADYHFAL